MARKFLSVVGLLIFVSVSANAQLLYKLIEVGALGSSSSVASIDQRGRVAGAFRPTASLGAQAFIWRSGTTQLEPFIPITPIYTSSAVGSATTVSAGTVIIGHMISTSMSPAGPHGFCLTQTPSGFQYSSIMYGTNAPRAINRRGVIVGQANMSSGSRHGYMKDNCSAAPIDMGLVPTLSGNGYQSMDPTDINVHNEVARITTGPSKPPRAFYYVKGSPATALSMPAVTVHSYAYAINDRHDIVEHAKGVATDWVPVIWSRSGIGTRPYMPWWPLGLRVPRQPSGFMPTSEYIPRILPMLPRAIHAKTYGINNRREIVGTVKMPSGYRAFSHKRNKMIDLNDATKLHAGWVLQQANDINDRGEIVGYGKFNGTTRAFKLVPL